MFVPGLTSARDFSDSFGSGSVTCSFGKNIDIAPKWEFSPFGQMLILTGTCSYNI